MTIPFWPIFGGVLIGASAVLLMWMIGRVAGISGIIWGSIAAQAGDKFWRWMFLIGIVSGTFIFHALSGRAYPQIHENYPMAAFAGIIVGIGVALGNGCTSGHGVCGMSRFSTRSIVATLTFMVVAVVTVSITNIVLGGSI